MSYLELSGTSTIGSGISISLPTGFRHRLLGGDIYYAASGTGGNRSPRLEAHNPSGAINMMTSSGLQVIANWMIHLCIVPGGGFRDTTSLATYGFSHVGWPPEFWMASGSTLLFQDVFSISANDSVTYNLLFEQQSTTPPPPTPGDATPSGTVMAYGGGTPPTGWLLCDGSAVSRTTYAALFTVIGTTFGNGDGSTTFGLPDLRGRAPFGKDNMGGTAANRITSGVSGLDGMALGAGGGDQRSQQHNHVYNRSNGPTGAGTNTGALIDGGFSSGGSGAIQDYPSSGGNAQNMPPALILNYIIKT